MASAQTLNCPMCGAATSSDATLCEHCGARLATVACPSCFGLMFLGSKFCSHCGARMDRTEEAASARFNCPRCGCQLNAVKLANTQLMECPKCEGIWADSDTLQQICVDREKQGAVLGTAGGAPPKEGVEWEQVHYIPCPVCKKLMNRVNFAHCSHVVVDVCRLHGTWFDKDELRRIVEFIRAGGLEAARAREMEELERRRRELQAVQSGKALDADRATGWPAEGWDKGFAVTSAAEFLRHLFD
jgi:Zn-finger nucleic acid-binding protein